MEGDRGGWEGEGDGLTGYDPELPEHNEGAANPGRGNFGGEDGDGGVLGADSDAHYEARGEEALPVLCERGGDGRGGQAEGGDEDFAATAAVVVEGINDPRTTGFALAASSGRR